MPRAELVRQQRLRLRPNFEIDAIVIRKSLGHIINCKEASRLVSRGQDGPLTTWQRITLRLHLSVCIACTRFQKHVDFLRAAMQRYRS